MRRFLLVLTVAIGLGAGLTPAGAGGYVTVDETLVHSLVNGTRAQKGLGALTKNDQLVAMARGQADKMAAKHDIYHNPRLGAEITERGLAWQRVGENVGMGPDVKVIEQAFLGSPHHYENIVDPRYDSMGIGVVLGDDDLSYVVQVFADLKSAAPVAPAPVKVAAPKPSVPTPAAPPVPVRTAPPAPVPTPAPPPATPLPNALTGGFVNEIELPDLPSGASGAAPTLQALVEWVSFWS